MSITPQILQYAASRLRLLPGASGKFTQPACGVMKKIPCPSSLRFRLLPKNYLIGLEQRLLKSKTADNARRPQTSKASRNIDRSFTASSLIFKYEGLIECVNQGFRSFSNTGQKRVPLFVTNPNKSAPSPAPTGTLTQQLIAARRSFYVKPGIVKF